MTYPVSSEENKTKNIIKEDKKNAYPHKYIGGITDIFHLG